MKRAIFMFAVAALVGFTACEKENEVNLPNNNENTEKQITNPIIKNINGTLHFETVEDFNSTLKKVRKMTKVERIAWEQKHNFQSIGSLSDEFYENIDFNLFNDMADLKKFVKDHDNYLEFLTDSNGEISLCTKYENNGERYLMDKNGLYVIANEVYKQLDSVVISCPTSEIPRLQTINTLKELNIPTMKIAMETIDKQESISPVKEIFNTISTKESFEHVGSEVSKTRIVLFIETKNVNKKGQRHRRLEYQVKNQKKTLGVWVRGPRTTTYLVHFETAESVYIPDIDDPVLVMYRSKTEEKFAVDGDHDEEPIRNDYASAPYISYANCWATNWTGCSAEIKR